MQKMQHDRKRKILIKEADEVCQRIENWIRLKQLVDWLPFEYSYSFECDYSPATHDFESQVNVQLGDQSWTGFAYGDTEFVSLAESLRRLESAA